MDYKIRAILEGEVSLLQDFLYEAIFVPEGLPAPPKSTRITDIHIRFRKKKRRYRFGCRS